MFHNFMEAAEDGWPVRPLKSLANAPVLAAAAPTPQATPEIAPATAAASAATTTPAEKPSTIEDILDGLFGGK
jgi:3-oxoacyl-ACP reductase-like protein